HTRSKRDWSSDVCSSDLPSAGAGRASRVPTWEIWCPLGILEPLGPRALRGPSPTGRRNPMVRRVSIKDVAQHAGVSWKTVSNVVNERPVVRAETRARVEQAIAELGYVPNRAGRELRGGFTGALALVVPELQNPYFARLAERMQ